MVPTCELAIQLGSIDEKISYVAAYVVCSAIFNDIMLHVGDTNYYDIILEGKDVLQWGLLIPGNQVTLVFISLVFSFSKRGNKEIVLEVKE